MANKNFSNPIQRGLYGATYGRGTNFAFID